MSAASRLTLAATTLATALTLLAAPAAVSSPPENLREELTDHVGVVGDPEAIAEVQDRLVREKGLQLFVVVVDDFDGQDPQAWLAETARLSRLGEQDIAVAISDGTRELTSHVPDGTDLSRRDVDRAVVQARTLLAAGDTDGAITAIVTGLDTAGQRDAQQQLVRGLWWFLGALALASIVGLLVLTGLRRARRRRQDLSDLDEATTLMRETGAATIALDDAVARAGEEADFAAAEFDAPLVASITETVAGAKDQALEAHRRRAAVATGPVDAPSWQLAPGEALRELRSIDELTRTALVRVAGIPALLDDLRRESDLVPARITRLREMADESGGRHPAQVRSLLDRAEADVAADRPEAAMVPLQTVVALLGPS